MIKTKKRLIQVNPSYESLGFREETLGRFFDVMDVLALCPIPQGELSVVFLDDAGIARLHEKYLNDQTATDVITFPGDAPMDFAGEICISVDHAIKAGKEYDQPFSRELTLYLVHGWLHLAGFDDRSEEERIAMRKAERECLVALEKAGAMPDFFLS